MAERLTPHVKLMRHIDQIPGLPTWKQTMQRWHMLTPEQREKHNKEVVSHYPENHPDRVKVLGEK